MLAPVLRIWNVGENQEAVEVPKGQRFVAFSSAGDSLLTLNWNELLTVECSSGKVIGKINGPEWLNGDAVLAANPDGSLLAAGEQHPLMPFIGMRSGLRILKTDTGEQLAQAILPLDIMRATFSPDGSILGGVVNSFLKDGQPSVRLWSLPGGQETTLRPPSWPVAFAPDGRWLACQGRGKEVTVLDAKSGQEVFSLHCPESLNSTVALA
jgi:WD40 repeat protein